MENKIERKRSLFIEDCKKEIKHLKRINFLMFIGYMTSITIIKQGTKNNENKNNLRCKCLLFLQKSQ